MAIVSVKKIGMGLIVVKIEFVQMIAQEMVCVISMVCAHATLVLRAQTAPKK